MMSRPCPAAASAAACVVLGAASTHAAAQPALFIPLPGDEITDHTWAYGVSPDGQFAAGSERNSAPNTTFAMRWTLPAASRLVIGDLPGGAVLAGARDASLGGAVLVGMSTDDGGTRPVRWTEPTGLVTLPDLPGGSTFGEAHAVSRDGAVAVGVSSSASGPEAVRWTTTNGVTTAHGLGDLVGGAFASVATGISADGSIVVGTGTRRLSISDQSAAFRWTESGGMVALPGLGNPGHDSFATDVSGDGRVVVGRIDRWAVKWVDGANPIQIGDLPGQQDLATPEAVNFDGSVIVGNGHGGQFSIPQAVVWLDGAPPVSLMERLTGTYGLDLAGWWLDNATGVSDDGTVIVGSGRDPTGRTRGFVVVLPTPASAALLGVAAAWASRRRRTLPAAR